METSVAKMKCCGKCKADKPLIEFYKDKKSRDGRQNRCKLCNKVNNKQYNIDNPNYQKQYHLDNPEYKKQWNEDNPKYDKNHKSSEPTVYGLYDGDTCLYIGQSIQLTGRWAKHKTLIKNPDTVSKHHSNHVDLYNNIRSHSNVDYRIIEEVSPEVLLQREQYYIDAYKPLYNIHNNG
tara:strand:- start:441 stop:974 length:534 start_codon:yes stop_codon:yes gene_type:complete